MISRDLLGPLREAARLYPVVTLTGPRQSGKTTLCTAAFADKARVSLEPLDLRQAVREDPRGFLSDHAQGVIIDEVQHVPELLSYLQEEVDKDPSPGRFILTGSQHFGLSQAVSQSLAGRSAILHLLPPSLSELARFPSVQLDDQSATPDALWERLSMGAYPRIYDRGIPAARWLADYVTTYVERDVRSLVNAGNLSSFTTFLTLVAGRSATELKVDALAADVGVASGTVRNWLSILEQSFLVLRIPAWHRNLRKQAIKAPKIHLLDSGLHCHLLGISSKEQLRAHPLRGAVFESWVVSECYKSFLHRGKKPRLFHFRDAKKLEVDLVVEDGMTVALIEAKSGATVSPEYFAPLTRVRTALETKAPELRAQSMLVYGGSEGRLQAGSQLVPWHRFFEHLATRS